MLAVDGQHAVDLLVGAGRLGQSLLNVAAGVVVDELKHALTGVEGIAALLHGAVEGGHDALHGVGGGAVQVKNDQFNLAHNKILCLGIRINTELLYHIRIAKSRGIKKDAAHGVRHRGGRYDPSSGNLRSEGATLNTQMAVTPSPVSSSGMVRVSSFVE